MASNVQQQQTQQQCIRQRQRWRQRQEQPVAAEQQQQQQQLQQQQQQQLQQSERTSLLDARRRGTPLLVSFSSGIGKLLQFGVVATLLQFSVLLLLTLGGSVVHGEGNVGCQFVRTLCLDGSEVCYDDNIFGKCIPTTGVDVEDIEKTPLTEDESRTLATMLEELQGAGLGWDHPYVQCRIQGTLFSLQRQTPLPPNLCAILAPSPTDVDPASALAFVRFTPPDEDYADPALYYPPLKKQTSNGAGGGGGINTILHQLQLQDQRQLRHDPLELAHFGKLEPHHLNGPQLDAPNVMDAFLETERERIEHEQAQRESELEAERKHALRNRLELYQMLAGSEPDPQPYQRNQPGAAMEQLEQVIEHEPAPPPPPVYLPAEELSGPPNEYYFPGNYAPFKRGSHRSLADLEADPAVQRSFFRELAAESHPTPAAGAPIPAQREYYTNSQLAQPLQAILSPTYKRIPALKTTDDDEDEENSIEDVQREQQVFEESLIRNSLTPFEEEAMLASNSYPHKPHNKAHKLERVFTEGGLVFVPNNAAAERRQLDAEAQELKKEKARELLANMLGFTRHERLDVKKPGPLIGPPANAVEEPTTSKSNKTTEAHNKEVLPAHIKGSPEASKKKKVVVKDHSEDDHAPHAVDTEYAHVFVKNPIDSWSDGVRIVNELANILHMQGSFTYLTVQPHEVSFRVDSNNPERKTASDIARVINENRGVKNNILRRLGVTVMRAGVGDKIKSDEDGGVSSSRIELAEQGPDVTHIMAYMFAGAGAAAVIVIFVTLILIKRHDKKRDKLGGLQSGIAGAESCSKDYQDLCRARMAGKGNAGEPATAASGRITSLSKENDRPPSSRSSTSSWSEEPALTNMDISTGHMVLSYMEDHLRNKGRLQREWEALCRYEAEPSAREAAQQPERANLNRAGAPLPYDHSRVVLNHLANEEGLDYINASTITDHDPRAPAYVAAQGPLPTTLAHFWQMIWEQGAVVIVDLCRLQENGEIACARYWPEEGAEVYHIYEVHLVSEHIWCDDYLVRSFYLKNLRTTETRTVTQFHFLSWPQGGVPAQAKALLDFRRKVNKSYRGRSCPIVVHGSAGAGRTGAYILLDLVLGRMNKGAREIDIAATLEHLRDQRAGVVATRQQFEFVLMAVAEEVHAILKALPANQSNEKQRDLEAATRAVAKETTAGATGVLMEEEVIAEEVASTSSSAKTTATKTTAKETDTEKTDKTAKNKPAAEQKQTTATEKEAKSTPDKKAAPTVVKKK